MKGRSVVGLLAGVMKGRNVSMEVKRSLRNSILLPTLTYGSENWIWNGAQQSRVLAVEMSYLRGICGVNRWDGLSNESVYERCGMRGHGSGVGCCSGQNMGKRARNPQNCGDVPFGPVD